MSYYLLRGYNILPKKELPVGLLGKPCLLQPERSALCYVWRPLRYILEGVLHPPKGPKYHNVGCIRFLSSKCWFWVDTLH